MAEPAIEVRRGGRVESVLLADVAVVDSTGRLVAWLGDAQRETYWRSAAKPFQAIPVITGGAALHFAWAAEDLAVMAGSHGGEPQHVTRVASILHRLGLPPEALLCGVHAPTTASAREALRQSGQGPTVLHNNCSGKHAGMLAQAVWRGAPLETYPAPDHPVQVEIQRVVGLYTGLAPAEVATAVDGCGVPTFFLSLARMAYAYARLTDPRGIPDAEGASGLLIAEAMRRFPELTAGEGRLEVQLTEATEHMRLTAKSGAEAVFCLALPDRGLGIAVKMDAGIARGLALVVGQLLADLAVLPPADTERVLRLGSREIVNHAGTVVGEMVPVLNVRRSHLTAPRPAWGPPPREAAH